MSENLPCKKIGSFILPCPIKKKLIVNYGTTIDNKFVGISYYNIVSFIQKLVIKKFIPKKYEHLFEVTWMEITSPYIPPHTDSHIKCVINIYIKTNNATTSFYTIKNTECQTMKIKNQTDGSIFDEKSLEKVCEFTADTNDAWLLNVKTPHSVRTTNLNSNDTRTAYCLQTKHLDYDTVKKILNITI